MRLRNLIGALVTIASLTVLGCRSRPETATTPRAESAVTSLAPRYVDESLCGDCHTEIADFFREHPMGRSLAVVAPSSSEVTDTPFDASGYRYSAEVRDDVVWHRQDRLDHQQQQVVSVAQPTKYVVGSGRRGRSYIIEQEGALFASPITWYAEQPHWALSPGYEKANSEFHRPVVDECLFCHANAADHIEYSTNRYRDPVFFRGCAIGCQRCHGPASQHVAFQVDGEGEDEIINPVGLTPDREDAVCQQCHMSGAARVLTAGRRWDDFRPGQSLADTFRIFVWESNESGREARREGVANESADAGLADFVGHFEQMYDSQCFRGSSGRLKCISCHDPHRLPSEAERAQYYRDKCLTCHQVESCSESVDIRNGLDSPDDCVTCHMAKRRTEVRHAAISDHSIPRRPRQEGSGDFESSLTARLRLVEFTRPDAVADSTANDRDHPSREYHLAVVRLYINEPGAFGLSQFRESMRALEQIARSAPDDIGVWDGLAQGYLTDQHADDAFMALQRLLHLAPMHEGAASNLGNLLSAKGRPDEAYRQWDALRRANPGRVRYWYETAAALQGARQTAACRELASEGVTRFPTSMGLRHLLIASLLEMGETEEADRQMAVVRRFAPSSLAELEAWYQRRRPLSRSGKP